MEEKKKYYSLKELEQTINLDEFTKDWCSDDGLDCDELSKKYNGSECNIKIFARKRQLKRSPKYLKNKIKQTNLKKYGVENPFQSEEIKEKIKQTNLKKYGVEHASQNEVIKEKVKQTNLEKYGVAFIQQNITIREKTKQTNLERYSTECSLQNEEVRNKLKETCLNRYGVECALQNNEIKEKIKQTNLKKYGVENAFANKEIKEKIKQTNLEKYGVESPLQNKEIKNKMKHTNINIYGVENPFQSEEIKEKIKQTNLEKYGVEHALQNKEIKNKVKQTNLEKYGTEYSLQSCEVRDKIKQTNLEKYGVEYISQNEDIKNKIKQTNLEKYGVKYVSQNEVIKEKIKQTILEKYGVEYACQAEFCKNRSNGMHSKPNEKFAQLLDENHIQYTREFPLKNKSYDFKINNILIEIDPSATHNSTWGTYNKNGIEKNYHKNKTRLANQNGYNCIHIFDWDDQNKVINMLKPKINIYARSCEIKELQDNEEYQKFINSNHLQGYCKGNKIIISLYYKNELVEIMSFGKPRYNKKYEYELLRLCTKSEYTVAGGTEKLLSYFIDKYKPKSIISYCDNSKFSGQVYHKLGFSEKNHTESSKHWYNMKTKQHITDNLLRQRGFDQLFSTNYGKNKSNNILMHENGFVEIYDCGQTTYIWKKKEE